MSAVCADGSIFYIYTDSNTDADVRNFLTTQPEGVIGPIVTGHVLGANVLDTGSFAEGPAIVSFKRSMMSTGSLGR